MQVTRLAGLLKRLTEKFGVNLDDEEMYLCLKHQDKDEFLVIERTAAYTLRVALYVEYHRQWVTDPSVVLRYDRGWIPIAVTRLVAGWVCHISLKPDALCNDRGTDLQAALVRFTEEVFFSQLSQDAWLERSQPASFSEYRERIPKAL